MSAPMLTPGSGGGSKPKPKPEPQKPTVPLVVYTAFDRDTAEALKERLEETIHPVDQPSPARKKATHDPPPYEHESSKGPKAAPADRKTRIASEPVIPDLPQDIPWSSETPFPSLDAGEMSDYFSAQEHNLVRDVSISLQREKFILHYLDEPLEYLKHFATYTWDEESDAAAEKFIQWYVKRFRTELERQRESDWSLDALSDIEYWIREVANDERESVIVYDLETGDILLVRYGDKDSVTMQDWHQRLTEGRNIVVIHNHPNNSGASPADLSAAAWLDAEYMMIVNRDGTVHRHQKIDGEIVELEPLHNPDIIAPVDPLETAAHAIAYGIQSLREIGNPPEMVFEQGEVVPKLSDYINHPQSKRADRPRFDRAYARYIPLPTPPGPHFAKHYYTSMNFYLLQSLAISGFARISGASGFDMAGKLLKHHLDASGEPYEIPVDEMLADVPELRRNVIDALGFGLGERFAPGNSEGGGTDDMVLEEVGDHTVYAFPLEWRQVGKGTTNDIFEFDGDMPVTGIGNLLLGKPIPEDATQEAYDWYLALGKFYYYPQVTVVVDNNTGRAEVGLVIEVRDHYNWHAGAGPLDWTMAELETKGYGKNFQVFGRSSPILGGFDFNDVETKNEKPYYQLKIEGWDEQE